MSNLKYLKGVRTRYRNNIQTDMQNGKRILSSEISKPDEERFVLEASKCAEKLKMYSEKLEIQSSKVACVMETEGEDVDNLVEEDCSLCASAMDCYLDLTQFKERLVDFIKTENSEIKGSEFSGKIVELQREMKDIMQIQIDQQQKILAKQSNDNETNMCSVKLPKLELPFFNDNKTKWIEFLDSFESSVHKNRKLSDVEKLNYLCSKLQGEAKRAISGLTLSSENYTVAVKILEDRFGNKQDMIDIHYNKLINLQSPSSKTSSLREFLDIFTRHIRSLEVLKQDINQDVFISIIRSKLPEDVKIQLEIQKGAKAKWTVPSLCEKLNDYVVARENSSVTEKSDYVKPSNFGKKFEPKPWRNKVFNPRKEEKRVFQTTNSAEALISTVNSPKIQSGNNYFDKCRYCGDKHWSDECQRFQTIEERKRQLKGSCFKCLKNGHSSYECKRNKLCIYCNGVNSHHRSLCPKKFKLKNTSVLMSDEITEYCFKNSENVQECEIKEECKNEQENVLLNSGEMVLMQTAKTEVRNQVKNKKEHTRILFDSGSQRTYISQRLATKLDLTGYQGEEIKLVTFGSEKAKIVKTTNTRLDIKLTNGKYLSVVANIVPVISGTLNRRKLDAISVNHLVQYVSNMYLADNLPTENESSEIDLLIGNDYYMDFILSHRIQFQPGLFLLSSKLGWIVTGRVKEQEDEKNETGLLIMSHTSGNVLQEQRNTSIRKMDYEVLSPPDLTDFWQLESIGIVNLTDNTDDETAMKIFKETLQFEKGRYQVKWPWKEVLPELPVNRSLALGRLKSNVDRMKKKKGIIKQYDSIIQDQLAKEIIEKIDKSDTEGLVHYIPHHAVITPLKTTTKVRIVYDASAKTKKEMKILNECVYRGPVLLQNLCGMLIRFRLYKIAIVADIEKAFLQVGLQSSERNVTRFLWLKDSENPTTSSDNIQEYRFCRVPFGVISSPFLLGATIDSHLMNYNTPCANKIRNDIYVDNLITGANSVADATNVYFEAKTIFKKASMNLREWTTNETKVNESIPDEDKMDGNSTKVLGHVWNTEKDTISIKPSGAFLLTTKVTKRATLKRIAEIFDPLGLFSPVLIQG